MSKLVLGLIVFFSIISRVWAAPLIIPEVNTKKTVSLTKKDTAPLQITHFTRKQIEESPVVTFSELLKQEQSIVRVTNNSDDSSQTILSIRGFGDNAVANTLILVDGFPWINASLLAPNLNALSLSDIERIDIIEGSEGSLWGDQAVGGVVNIVTRHPERLLAEGVLGLGSFQKQFYSGYVSNKLNNGLFFKLFGFANQTNQFRDHNRELDNNLNMQLGLDTAHGVTYLNVQAFNNSVEFPGGLTETEFKENPRKASNNQYHFHYHTDVYQVLNKYELTENWFLETRLMHKNVLGNGFMYVNSHLNDSINFIKPELHGFIGKNKLVLGYEGQYNAYHLTNILAHNKAQALQNNLFSQMTIPLKNKLDLILGARYAAQKNTTQIQNNLPSHSLNQILVAESGLVMRVNEDWQLYLRRDGNFRFPKTNEDAWTSPEIDALQMQKGVSYETGASWNRAEHKTQLSFYILTLHNEIAFDPTETEDAPFGSFKNFTDTVRRGGTFTETYQVTPKLLTLVQINGVDARFSSGLFKNNFIPAVPAWNGNIGADYDWTEHFKTKMNALYTGSRYASEDQTNTGKKLPGYWLVTVALQYLYKPFITSFEINNVFNQTYAAYAIYDTEHHSNLYYPGSGLSYLLTLKANLD